jgi:hypothetical protein
VSHELHSANFSCFIITSSHFSHFTHTHTHTHTHTYKKIGEPYKQTPFPQDSQWVADTCM